MPKAVPLWAAGAAVLFIVVGALAGFAILRWTESGTSSLYGQPSNQQGPPEFPRLQLQGQFAGPIQGTVIQRWRDPIDGTICYIYIPMVVQHSPAPAGYVQYGSNSIGSITCLPKAPAG